MCQSEGALHALAALEEAGALVINSALAIRNCYRDLMGPGLTRAGVPTPRGALLDATVAPDKWRLEGIDPARGLYVKRGDLHALDAKDVCRVDGHAALESAVAGFASRGVRRVYVQQEAPGRVIKFYGVTGGEYFAALDDDGALPDAAERRLRQCAELAASALGLEAWGGDAMFNDGNEVTIIDFNDWPSFSRVRNDAARAIARRCQMLLRRPRRIAPTAAAATHRPGDNDS
jgi:glutathione synthase/RimK-type ligase-like ATP-grasp enzyme